MLPVNQVICGDCLEVLKTFPDNCIDTIITDPPYALGFMGKEWDKFSRYQEWVKKWAKEVLRVAKPGATLLCFGGTRTYHRLACGIEDAGWVIKDCIMWIYGQGFPKATDISKQIDKKAGKKRKIKGYRERFGREGRKANCGFKKEYIGASGTQNLSAKEPIEEPATPEAKLWNGWKSHGLKPAYEPILVAMKPNEGSYADNALKWGVAGLNIDGARIPTSDMLGRKLYQTQSWKNSSKAGVGSVNDDWKKGRFPANIILECICDEIKVKKVKGQGMKKGTAKRGSNDTGQVFKGDLNKTRSDGYVDEDGTETVKIHTNPNCPCYMLDEVSGVLKSGKLLPKHTIRKSSIHGFTPENWKEKEQHPWREYGGDKGGASRFFYCAKASRKEREIGGVKNNHPTVKPLKLLEYLCILTKTPTGGIVLDPFAGSGTTGMACKLTGRNYILIEKEKEYCEIAKARINATQRSLI